MAAQGREWQADSVVMVPFILLGVKNISFKFLTKEVMHVRYTMNLSPNAKWY